MKKTELAREFLILRKQKKLSQRALSDISGATQATISEIEQGKANPSLDTLLNIANALGAEIKIEKRK